MKFVALASFCIGGGVDVREGQIIDLPHDQLTKSWIANGRMRQATIEEAVADLTHRPDPNPEVVATQDPDITHREPTKASEKKEKK